MPTFIQEVPELDICVRRPVINDVLTDLFRQTNINTQELKIYQMGRTVAIPQLNSTLDESVNKERLQTDTRVEVSMQEEITNLTISPILYPNNISVFHDEALQVSVVPTMVPTKTSINVRFVCRSRVEAMNWLGSIRRQVSQRMFNPIHTVNYYYPIPMEHMYALSKIHEMRETVAGYGDTFGEWLKQKFNHRFSVITNSAGRGAQFVIREQQTNVIGYYEFGEEVEKPDKNDGNGSYSVEFTYTFHYERPENVIIKYPIVIHNQIVPEEIRDDRQVEDTHPDNYYLTNDAAAFHSFSFSQQNVPAYKAFAGLPVPHFDDWYPKHKQLYYENMVRVSSQISPNHLRWVGNIDQVRPYYFAPHVIAYMKSRPQAMVYRRQHLFTVSVHRWDNLWDTQGLIIDPDLKVSSPVDMNLRDMWHMNIDICYDISVLSDEGLKDLCEHPKVLEDWVDVFRPDTPLTDIVQLPPGYYCEDGSYCPPGGYDEDGNQQPGGGWCADGSYNPGTYDVDGVFTPGCVYCEDGSYCPPGDYDKDGNYQPPGGYDDEGNEQPGGYNPDDVREKIYESDSDREFLMRQRKAKHLSVGIYGLIVRRDADKKTYGRE